MVGQRKYSDILDDILKRKHSNCTCPPEYFSSSMKPKNPNTECCQFGPDCQFVTCGDNVPVPVLCQYNQAKCTCFSQCICGPRPEVPVQLLQGPELDRVICKQMCTCSPQPEQSALQGLECICGGNCYCESEDTLASRNIYRPTPNCDKTRCICNICLCQPDASNSRLLPTDFRNAVKKEPLMSTDERIKQECAEIKQLLIDHEESIKKELEEEVNLVGDKVGKKQIIQKVSIVEDSVPPVQQSDTKEDPKDSIAQQEELKSSKSSMKNIIKEAKESAGTIKSKKLSRREKTPKRTRQIKSTAIKSTAIKSTAIKSTAIKSTAIKSKSATPSQFTQYSCGCRMPKKKPLRMRYYFSGGTEHYGVKLGHKQCMPKPANVPKNMGWLWNIEDHSKGIRERKGWPPGFIAKNIKNMIKVLKQFEDPAEPGLKGMPTRAVGGGRSFGFRRREEGEVGTEPQDEPPLLHIHKKGRTYNITFCPKSSDTDVGPIPIPFSITEKKQDSDSSSSDSTLEFEFHSPKPKRPQLQAAPQVQEEKAPEEEPEPTETSVLPPSTSKATKKKFNKKRSLKSIDENKNLWEEQQTQIENIA